MTTDETVREIEALPDDMFLRTPNPDPDNRQFVYSPDLKALAAELKLYREFVGAMRVCGVEIKDDKFHGFWADDTFKFATGTFLNHIIAIGTDPFDAWRNLRNQELSEVESEDA